ncbi:MAG: biotin--[acetyl-CoA-carboxylase] ligase [Armatimonadota bacterium]
MIGTVVYRYDTVSSTNDTARKLAEDGAAEGTVVVALEQTMGRGSRGRAWFSPPGLNLLVSVILRPNLPLDRMGELAFVAAIAVAVALRDSCGLDAAIKWPNDVRVRDRKISGMIVETAKGAAILGVGINVNWTELSEEIASKATSAALELGRPIDTDCILKSFLEELDIAYGVYRARGFTRTLQDWRELENTTGRQVTITAGGECIEGIAAGIDENGSLIVDLPAGERRSIPAAGLVR